MVVVVAMETNLQTFPSVRRIVVSVFNMHCVIYTPLSILGDTA